MLQDNKFPFKVSYLKNEMLKIRGVENVSKQKLHQKNMLHRTLFNFNIFI